MLLYTSVQAGACYNASRHVLISINRELSRRGNICFVYNVISRCYVVAMFNMQHNALNLIFCTGPEGLNDTWHFEKVNAV